MQTNEELFRILIEDGFSKGDVSVFDKYTSPDFVEHQDAINPRNIEGVKKTINELHGAFPDYSLIIEDLVSAGDKVWGRLTSRGTHRKQFGPMPPTNKTYEITVIDIMRFKEGKLVEHWGVADGLALMEQLGMKPPPAIIMKILSKLQK